MQNAQIQRLIQIWLYQWPGLEYQSAWDKALFADFPPPIAFLQIRCYGGLSIPPPPPPNPHGCSLAPARLESMISQEIPIFKEQLKDFYLADLWRFPGHRWKKVI